MVIAMDSVYLALMVLTFFIPLVIYFGTCVGVVVETGKEKEKDREKDKDKELVTKNLLLTPITKMHPVLRQNCAITRLVSEHDIINNLRLY